MRDSFQNKETLPVHDFWWGTYWVFEFASLFLLVRLKCCELLGINLPRTCQVDARFAFVYWLNANKLKFSYQTTILSYMSFLVFRLWQVKSWWLLVRCSKCWVGNLQILASVTACHYFWQYLYELIKALATLSANGASRTVADRFKIISKFGFFFPFHQAQANQCCTFIARYVCIYFLYVKRPLVTAGCERNYYGISHRAFPNNKLNLYTLVKQRLLLSFLHSLSLI